MRKKVLQTSLLSTLFLFLSCNISKMTFGNSKNWIPENFNPQKTILLVQKFDASAKIQEQMEEYMSTTYPYKYEFATNIQIANKIGKYADTKLYKYALMTFNRKDVVNYRYVDANNIRAGGPMNRNDPTTYKSVDFNFYDRDGDKNYPSTQRPSSSVMMTFKPVINTIVKKFE